MSDFCHLHCHTHYSLLDGAADIKKMLRQAADLDIPAVAITDHGNVYGIPEFYKAAKDVGVQPIYGCEFYLTPSGMQDRNDRTRYHQVLLAKNEVGYRNLTRLASLAYTEGFYYKPRIDRDTLRAHSEGLIATTCCLQGEVLQAILKRTEEEAEAVFREYLSIFGDDYYIEIQDHGLPEQRKCNAVLLKWAEKYSVKIIATNDVHYVQQDDAAAQDVMLCLQTGKDLHDPSRMRFENDQFYLKSAAQMEQALLGSLDRKSVFQALENTREIAEKCNFKLPMGKMLMPHFPLPATFATPDDYLRHLTYQGAKRRYPEMPQHVVERLDFELNVIKAMGYAGYFLIVQDFTTAAREMGVAVGPGRGSAAGSAIAYCLGITNIDPLQYDLLFERFLNPERVSMPDIDIDFDDRGRGRVIDYVVEKYGRENVCQIITFGTMGAKTAIRDVGRVLGIPLPEVNRIAKLIPEGPKSSLDSTLDDVPEFKALLQSEDASTRKLLHFARVLEGSARHTGVHAAGVIIAPDEVSNYVPVQMQKSNKADVITTQYDGKWVEEFGLLKMDFLGLKTLSILSQALELIRQRHGVEIDLDTLPLDDTKTYELFQRGETVAIFQFESSGMREWLQKLKPTEFNDLIAMNALYRPGPMELIPLYINRKHGKESVEYPHPLLEDILKPTYGIPVYQEQVMQMAQVMGGYSLGGADLLRRAMGKKKADEMARHRETFRSGAMEKGVTAAKADEVFDMMEKFAGYGFNKSHSAAYSILAYQTAYLKAHYPPEFMAAVMASEMNSTEKLAIVLDEAKHMQIKILPPCVVRGEASFTVDAEGHIRFGLAAIKGVGQSAVESLIETRTNLKKGFTSFFQMISELDLRTVGKKALESMILAGATDVFEGHRAQHRSALDAGLQYAQRVQADRAAGQHSLFGMMGPANQPTEPGLPVVDTWPRAEQLKHERELLGFFVSGHPLDAFALETRDLSTASLRTLLQLELPDSPREFGKDRGVRHEVVGLIAEVKRKVSRDGKPFAILKFEDYSESIELSIFSRELDRLQAHLQPDTVALVRMMVESRGGDLRFVANDILPMWRVQDELIRDITLRIQVDRAEGAVLQQVAQLCQQHRGKRPIYFELVAADSPIPLRLRSRNILVAPQTELLAELVRQFGVNYVRLNGGENARSSGAGSISEPQR